MASASMDVVRSKPDYHRSDSLLKTEEAALDVLHELDSFLEAEIAAARQSVSPGSSYGSLEVLENGRSLVISSRVCQKCGGKGASEDFENTVNTVNIVTAVRLGHRDCLSDLLQYNPLLLRETPSSRRSLLQLASELGHATVLEVLIRHELSNPAGADSRTLLDTTADGRGRCALHVIARDGNLACLRVILKYFGKAWQDVRSDDGRTALHHAAAGGHLKCLQELGRDPGDINVQDDAGKTPVFLTAENGHVECLQWLLENAKADPHLVARDGSTSLHAAAEAGHLQVVHWLVRRECCSLSTQGGADNSTPLHLAAGKGRSNILQWALQQKLSNGSELDRNGRTPGHYAALNGHLETLQIFLKFPDVDMNAEDDDYHTPRDLAENNGHEACANLLSVIQGSKKRGSFRLVNRLTRSLSGPARPDRTGDRRSSMRKTKERITVFYNKRLRGRMDNSQYNCTIS
ncbi:ankyrin repeat domain-containing protein 29-like isoform X2 [Ptychodera flava]|uniref:ankyrin repeat domain-containing protein 29-like isoform X2 n=1 Tax=Ptychodera flava TaxID=63121 RepID=UPI00396A5C81